MGAGFLFCSSLRIQKTEMQSVLTTALNSKCMKNCSLLKARSHSRRAPFTRIIPHDQKPKSRETPCFLPYSKASSSLRILRKLRDKRCRHLLRKRLSFIPSASVQKRPYCLLRMAADSAATHQLGDADGSDVRRGAQVRPTGEAGRRGGY